MAEPSSRRRCQEALVAYLVGLFVLFCQLRGVEGGTSGSTCPSHDHVGHPECTEAQACHSWGCLSVKSEGGLTSHDWTMVRLEPCGSGFGEYNRGWGNAHISLSERQSAVDVPLSVVNDHFKQVTDHITQWGRDKGECGACFQPKKWSERSLHYDKDFGCSDGEASHGINLEDSSAIHAAQYIAGVMQSKGNTGATDSFKDIKTKGYHVTIAPGYDDSVKFPIDYAAAEKKFSEDIHWSLVLLQQENGKVTRRHVYELPRK